MIRRLGERIKPGVRHALRPGVYAILRKGDLVLLTHQYAPLPELQLPGGGIEPGEQPIAALHREVLEETGFSMRLERRLGAYRRFTFMPDYELWAEKICTVYLARPGRRLGPPIEDGHLPVWLPTADAAEILGDPGGRSFLRTVAG